MLTSAIALASGVTAAVSNALATIFCADEVWEGLREFRGIGALPISADAVVGEGIWVTIVRICCGRFPWQLQAEQWARIYLTLAPGSSLGQRNAIGIDVINSLRVDFQGQQDDSQSSHGSLERQHCVVLIGTKVCSTEY